MNRLILLRFALTLSMVSMVWAVPGCSTPESGPSAPAAAADAAPPPRQGEEIVLGGDTPEETVRLFIEAEKAGNEAVAESFIWPDENEYQLKEKAPLKAYQMITKYKMTAQQAAEDRGTPTRREGDTVVVVWQEYTDGRTNEMSYFLREIDGDWRIFSVSYPL